MLISVAGGIMFHHGMTNQGTKDRADIKLKTLGDDAGTMYAVSCKRPCIVFLLPFK